MENNSAAPSSVSTENVRPMWEVLSNDLEIVTQAPKQENTPDLTTDNVIDQNQTITVKPEGEVKPATEAAKPAAETKPEGDKPAGEIKPTDTATDNTDKPLEFTLADIKDAPVQYEQDSFQALAQDVFGIKIEKDDFEDFKKSFKDNFIPKTEVEQYKSKVKEEYFSTLKPEVAAALELKELGMPDELLLNPTREIDEYLSLGDLELVRKEYEAKGMADDLIDLAIEQDTADGKIGTKSQLIRFNLDQNKKDILNTRSQLVNKYTAEKQQATVRQQEQRTTQIKEALNNVSAFLGVNVSKDAIQGIIHKVEKGAYDSELNNPKSLAELILYREFGERFSKISQDKALAKGKAEVTAKLSNIPIKQSQSGSKVIQTANDNDNASPFANMPSNWG